MQVEEFLEQSARRFGNKTALVVGNQRLSYAELDKLCNRLAHALVEEGVGRGERVAIYLENSVESVIAVFAILKAGAVFLVVNPTTKVDKLTYVLNNCRAIAIITHAGKLESIQECFRETPHLKTIIIAGATPGVSRQYEKHVLCLEKILHEGAIRGPYRINVST